ncbi:unnamed protein product [Clonostachys solani]|uniref:succinate-semialdehyde dehydrogenase [NAD(P)(+)] n=1 Tax=Clonostachys solani TaxID=160281 RepID=A0A9N9Z1F5_9HYPO|nr:unnamed protein product [Clonostachys solani]
MAFSHPTSAYDALSHKPLFREQGFIGGAWISGPETFPVHDPATNNVVANVASFDAAAFGRAIECAQAALQQYKETSEHQRCKFLHRFAGLIRSHASDLATLLTLENGKTLTEAAGEVEYGASFISWFAEEAIRSYGDIIPSQHAGSTNFTIRQPVGVCGIIAPWNFPVAMITRKLGPAFAAGCTVVIKPPSETPLCTMALNVLLQQAIEEFGLPRDIVQVVPTRNREAITELYTNPTVKKISFTGSTPVGKAITRTAADTMKKVSMELGGNAPYIIFNDADVKAAVDGVLACKFRCSGQTCVCANRLLVQAEIHDQFVQSLLERMKTFKVGSGFDPSVTHGPLVNKAAVSKVREHIDDAVSRGAKLLFGGHAPTGLSPRELDCGFFIEPALLTGVTTEMKVARDETFGPLAPIFKFDTVEDAIRIANDTEFGLAAYFFSSDMRTIWHVSRRLEAGMVGVNTGKISAAEAPFGGIKESGVGKEGSKYGLAEYQVIKNITIGGM